VQHGSGVRRLVYPTQDSVVFMVGGGLSRWLGTGSPLADHIQGVPHRVKVSRIFNLFVISAAHLRPPAHRRHLSRSGVTAIYRVPGTAACFYRHQMSIRRLLGRLSPHTVGASSLHQAMQTVPTVPALAAARTRTNCSLVAVSGGSCNNTWMSRAVQMGNFIAGCAATWQRRRSARKGPNLSVCRTAKASRASPMTWAVGHAAYSHPPRHLRAFLHPHPSSRRPNCRRSLRLRRRRAVLPTRPNGIILS
jgi:hypothetical protein